MARPKRGNFATGEAGLARYKEALRKYLAKTKKTTKPEVKKPVAKKPVAKKPATKKPAAKKPAAKKPVAKKPVAKKPATTKTTTRPKRTANNLKIKKAANTAAKTTKQVIKKATPVVKKAAKTVAKKAGETKKAVTKKVDQVKKTFKKSKAPRPTTPQQKFVSKVYQGTKKYGKRVLKKGGKDLLKIGKGILKNPKSAIKGGVAGVASTALTDAINTRTERVIAKRKGMTLKEFQAFKKDPKNQRGIVSLGKKVISKVRGKSGESSTQTNINKQKKANAKPTRGLKIRKTERSSRKNTNKDYNAPTATKKADKRFSTFRVNSNENLKLQKERQEGNTETYSRKLSPQAKKQTTETKTNKKKTKKQSKFIKTASGSLARRGTVAARRAENREKARKRAQEMARKRLANK